ncbi:hypothetical protein SKAU_G00157850 [Synaphobranchus kaupii]|uniref:Immunoglobulin domain-containing protein n=1 Tax=Synaphobranchus kaupii TaxID=118154 RepID=A0A9Q1FHX5_SYNKA|nr:hypothetical protein SKAU_G00157850 [Synaphobranchus kaupii]
MERICIAVIMIHMSSSQVRETSTEATASRVVQLGDTVILHCDVKHDKETIWHGQHFDKVPFIIIAAQDKDSGPDNIIKYFRGYDPRFRVWLLLGNNSVSLEIENLTISDLGLYYCTTTPGVPMLTGFGTRLVLAENHNLSTPNSNGSTVLTVGSKSGPWVQTHCWILLAILCPVCVMLGALLYSAYLHWKQCRKGKFVC